MRSSCARPSRASISTAKAELRRAGCDRRALAEEIALMPAEEERVSGDDPNAIDRVDPSIAA